MAIARRGRPARPRPGPGRWWSSGARGSPRAESRWYAAQGWTLIGMTGRPEAVLARELALCYTTIALVTDTDAGVEEGEGVTHAEVFRVFGENIGRLRDLLMGSSSSSPPNGTALARRRWTTCRSRNPALKPSGCRRGAGATRRGPRPADDQLS